MRKTFSVLAVLFLLSVVVGDAWGQVRYTVTDLGTLGGDGSRANGINNSGQVVGWAYTSGDAAYDAFLYSSGTMQDLGTLGGGTQTIATGISDSGQVVGWAWPSGGTTDHGFLYSGGAMQDLGVGQANGINSSGQVVGWNGTTGDAYVYSNGTMTNIGTLPNGQGSCADAINNSGQVAGYAGNGVIGSLGQEDRAFVYSGGTMQALGTFGGADSFATGINNSGQVVGNAWISPVGNTDRAFLYSGGSLQNLGTLGGRSSFATGINDIGQVVGDSDISGIGGGGTDAFLYSDDSMYDLNNLIPSNSGWTLEGATGINNSGQICGYGTNSSGQEDAFLLTPTPEPSTLTLLAIGAIGLAGYGLRRRWQRRLSAAAAEAIASEESPAILSFPCRSFEAKRRAA